MQLWLFFISSESVIDFSRQHAHLLARLTVSYLQRRAHTPMQLKKRLSSPAPPRNKWGPAPTSRHRLYRVMSFWALYRPAAGPWPTTAHCAGPAAAPTDSAAGRRWRDVSDPDDLGGETGVRTKSERTACPLIGIGGPIVFEKQRHSPLRFLSASSAIALCCGMSWAMSGPVK